MEVVSLTITIWGLIWAIYIYFKPRAEKAAKEKTALASEEEVRDWLFMQNESIITKALQKSKDVIPHFLIIVGIGLYTYYRYFLRNSEQPLPPPFSGIASIVDALVLGVTLVVTVIVVTVIGIILIFGLKWLFK